MRRIVLSCGLSTVPHYFHKGHDCREKKLLNIKRVFSFSLKLFSEIFLILIQRDIFINVHSRSCEVPIILFRFQWNLNFSTNFRRILKYKISCKSVQWGRVVPWGRTDRRSLFAMLRTRLKKKIQWNIKVKLFHLTTSYKCGQLSQYSDYSTEWTQESLFESRHSLEILLCSKTSLPTVGTTQPYT
jgi:hypothetical protein